MKTKQIYAFIIISFNYIRTTVVIYHNVSAVLTSSIPQDHLDLGKV